MQHVPFRAEHCITMLALAHIIFLGVIVEIDVRVHDGLKIEVQESCEDPPARAGGTIDLCLRTAR